ncbi:hypothetical protein [Pandoraea pnomenusa]|uniref:hypothetical protein n=1 Tax=Pandoraea pnomenusa TaxID=93220 RepID=UPI0012DAC50D|nr:hypothetical protein [Pandoraea pnomenusa]
MLFLAVAALAGGVSAYDSNGAFVTFVGNKTCGGFLNDTETISGAKLQYVAYIEGYISAINMRVNGKADFFAGTDQEARYRFVYEYCRAHPLDMFATGLFHLTKTAGVPMPK